MNELTQKSGAIRITAALIKYVIIIILAIAVSIVLRKYAFDSTRVSGESMYPTLHNDDVVLVSKSPIYQSDIQRNDIISLISHDLTKHYVKRVIGIEGDTIEIANGQVILNGNILNENYLENGTKTYSYTRDKIEVPKGYVYVLGDNRQISYDSRLFGLVPYERIEGVCSLIYAPIGRFKKL